MVLSQNSNGISYLSIAGHGSSSKALLFLPGIGAFKENYVTFLKEFRSVYSEIFILDLPEQGSKGDWRFGQMCETLAEFIPLKLSADVDHLDLMGHSAGALAILSYLTKYNLSVEEKIVETIKGDTKIDTGDLRSCLSNSEFCEPNANLNKIRKVVLFSPPDSMGVVFPKFWCKLFGSLNTQLIRIILNLFINYPLNAMGWLLSKPQKGLNIKKSKKSQFFALTFSNHQSFFNYIAQYLTFFELFRYLDNDTKDRLEFILADKEIFIQYGSTDWVIKSMFRSKKLEENYLINNRFSTYRHKGLGHLLKKRRSLDVNLYDQLLINPDVIDKTRQFLTNLNHESRD